MSLFRSYARQVGALLAVILVLIAIAGCGQAPSNSTASSQDAGDTAEAVLQAYRAYGGAVASLSTTSPTAAADVTNVVGTIPAYDLTGGKPPCAGFLQAVPSLVFALATDAPTVKIAFAGDTPTTLMVVAEGEAIICDERAQFTMTPELTLQQPKAGRYGVWIGRSDLDKPINGKVTVAVGP